MYSHEKHGNIHSFFVERYQSCYADVMLTIIRPADVTDAQDMTDWNRTRSEGKVRLLRFSASKIIVILQHLTDVLPTEGQAIDQSREIFARGRQSCGLTAPRCDSSDELTATPSRDRLSRQKPLHHRTRDARHIVKMQRKYFFATGKHLFR